MQDREAEKRRVDLEEQLTFPWDRASDRYRHADGWELNKNRISADKYLLEMGAEQGPATIPHRRR